MLDHRKPYFKKINETYVHFNVIDLDPYGSCIPFLDSAVQCSDDQS